MGGFFGLVSKKDCVNTLFFGTDYHSHLGTKRGGMAVRDGSDVTRVIHDISNSQFRTKFYDDLKSFKGNMGIGVISDFDDQPLIIASHLGSYSIVTVGKINNMDKLAERAFRKKITHYAKMGQGGYNPTEMIATLINEKDSIEEGIEHAFSLIEGSCSLLIMTEDGIIAARDRYGRTPIVLGKSEDSMGATFETCIFPSLGFEEKKYLGPGEIVSFNAESYRVLKKADDDLRVCSFLWVYYGYPSSCYEERNVESVRNENGSIMAREDKVKVDAIAGIPDSGIGHALGYSNYTKIPYIRPFVKYTPTWARSFMPPIQSTRELVARMKLIPIKALLEGKRVLFCDDSIVRGTQLKDNVVRLYEQGIREVHMRASCPPLLFSCPYLNFSRSRSRLDLAGIRAISHLEGGDVPEDISSYLNSKHACYKKMVEHIRKELNLSSLKFQTLDGLIRSIGLPKKDLCTYCWNGEEKNE